MAFRPASILHKVEFSREMYGGLDNTVPQLKWLEWESKYISEWIRTLKLRAVHFPFEFESPVGVFVSVSPVRVRVSTITK